MPLAALSGFIGGRTDLLLTRFIDVEDSEQVHAEIARLSGAGLVTAALLVFVPGPARQVESLGTRILAPVEFGVSGLVGQVEGVAPLAAAEARVQGVPGAPKPIPTTAAAYCAGMSLTATGTMSATG